MADKIKKFLRKLNKKQIAYLIPYVDRIVAGQLEGMDIKQLKGHKGIYRVRVGSSRIIFEVQAGRNNLIRFIGKRDDRTYRDF